MYVSAEKAEESIPDTASRGRVESSSGTQQLVVKFSMETRAWLLFSFQWMWRVCKHLYCRKAAGIGNTYLLQAGLHCRYVLLPANGCEQETRTRSRTLQQPSGCSNKKRARYRANIIPPLFSQSDKKRTIVF